MRNATLTEPTETQSGLEKAIYNSINRTALVLNETELNLLARQLQSSLALLQEEAIKLPEVRAELYRWYNERSRAGLTSSVFAAGFNMSIKGHNQQLKEKVDLAFAGAAKADLRGSPANAIACLLDLGIRHSVLFNPRIMSIVQQLSPAACVELTRIEQYKLTLFQSIMPLAAERARIAATASGTHIDYPDMAQEAFIAAIQALETYRPSEAKEGDGKTLTSFIFTSVNGHIAKRKAELSRTVRVPRTIYERFVQVLKVTSDMYIHDFFTEDLDLGEVEQIVEQSKRYNFSKGPFTTNEVEEIYGIMQHEKSFEPLSEIEWTNGEDRGYVLNDVAFSNQVESSYDMEVEYDLKKAKERLLGLIKKFASDTEFSILAIRWGRDDMLSYAHTASIYHAENNKPMNKTTVSNIEAAVFKRIRQACAADPKLKDCFTQIWESLQQSA